MMARVEFGKLDTVISNPNKASSLAEDSSICLSQFLKVLSNLAENFNGMSESELSMFTKSLQQYLNRRTFTTCKTDICLGDIFNVDFGINYEPEMAYNHPALVLGIVGDMVFVIPSSTSSTKISQAYDTIENPNGDFRYLKVGSLEGFAETCALLLCNICVVSKGRLLEKKGHLSEDISLDNSLFNSIRYVIMKSMFSKEYSEFQNIICKLEEENKTLHNKLKAIDNSLNT